MTPIVWTVAGAGLMNMMVVATEQNPARLGSTVQAVRLQVNHRLNMELHLQSLFGLHVHSCTHWLRPRNSPPPSPTIWAHLWGRYWSAKIDDISLWPSLYLQTFYSIFSLTEQGPLSSNKDWNSHIVCVFSDLQRVHRSTHLHHFFLNEARLSTKYFHKLKASR